MTVPFDSAALFQCSQAVALSLSRIDSSAVAIARLARSRLVAAQGAARALPVGRTDLLAGERARRQRQEQRPEPDRAGHAIVITAARSDPPSGVLNGARSILFRFPETTEVPHVGRRVWKPRHPPCRGFQFGGRCGLRCGVGWRASRPVRREWIRPELTQARGGNRPAGKTVPSHIGLSVVGLHLTRGGGITFNIK